MSDMMWHRPDPDGPDFPPHTGPREACTRCRQLPPEESLCGEEEALAAGLIGPEGELPDATEESRLMREAHALVDQLGAADSAAGVVEMLSVALHGVPDSVMDQVEEAMRVGGHRSGKSQPVNRTGTPAFPANSSSPEEPPDHVPVSEQLRAWALHVRGVGRSRQRAYYEALSLAATQFVAWRDAFPRACDAALREKGEPALGPREAQILGWFCDGFQGFLHETTTIARDGGR